MLDYAYNTSLLAEQFFLASVIWLPIHRRQIRHTSVSQIRIVKNRTSSAIWHANPFIPLLMAPCENTRTVFIPGRRRRSVCIHSCPYLNIRGPSMSQTQWATRHLYCDICQSIVSSRESLMFYKFILMGHQNKRDRSPVFIIQCSLLLFMYILYSCSGWNKI